MIVITTMVTILPIAHAEMTTNDDVSAESLENVDTTEDYYENLNGLVPGEDYIAGEMIIKYSPANNSQSLDDIAEEFDLTIEYNLEQELNTFNTLNVDDSVDDEGLYVLSFDQENSVVELVQEISAFEEVEYAQPNYIYETCETEFNYMANENNLTDNRQQAMIDSLNFGSETYTGEGVIVAVIDTGIDLAHPALDGCFWNHDGVVGYNTADPKNYTSITMEDDDIYTHAHGTHVAGIIAMQESAEYTCRGIAPDVKIMDLQASYSEKYFKSDSLIKALELAEENGADIVNMSLGTDKYDRALNLACNKAARKMVIIAAAGNDGKDRTANYPAALSSTIGVMAYGGSSYSFLYSDEIRHTFTNTLEMLNANYPTNHFMTMAEFSNYDSEERYYDIIAPGVNICSTKAREPKEKESATFNNFQYAYSNGTSMATPIISGIAALYIDKYADATPGQIRYALRQNSGKLVEIYSQGELIDLVWSGEGLSNQVDVTHILSIIPNTEVDLPYEHNNNTEYSDFCGFVKSQFDNSFDENENLTKEDIRLISFISIQHFSKISGCYKQLSELYNLIGIEFLGPEITEEKVQMIMCNNHFDKLDIVILYATEVEYLEIPYNFCPQLNLLEINYNDFLRSVSKLSIFPNITSINARECSINDISFLDGASNIVQLDFSNNNIKDISVLSQLTLLKAVSFYKNKVEDISPVAELPNITVLEFTDNLITNIGNVLENQSLYSLYVSNNPLQNSEHIIDAFLKSKNVANSHLSLFMFKPYKEPVAPQKISLYDIELKRTDMFVNPKIITYPFNSTITKDINLRTDNELILINNDSDTISYNRDYNGPIDPTDLEGVVYLEREGFSGVFNVSIILPTIDSVSLEKYTFDNHINENYISIKTTTATTRVRLNNTYTTEEYSLASNNITYEDYGKERLIKIKLDDNYLIDSDIVVSVGDMLGFLSSQTINDNNTIEIDVENKNVINISGSSDLCLLSNDKITGIATNAINSNSIINTLILSSKISNIQSAAFNNANVITLYIRNECRYVNANIINQCNNMVVYVSNTSPIASLSDAIIIDDFEYNSPTLAGYSGSDSEVTIPKYLKIERIGEGAFENNSALEKIDLSDGIIYIDSAAFKNCTKLCDLGGQLNIRSLGDKAFYSTGLHEVSFYYQWSVPLGASVFESCQNLETVNIQSLTNFKIGSNFFKNCDSLKYINIEHTLTLGDYAFEDDIYLESINFEQIILDGIGAFKNCVQLSGDIIYLGSSIPDESFYGCRQISSICWKNYSEGTLGSKAFGGTIGLNEVGIFCSSLNFELDSFEGCAEDVIIYTNGSYLNELAQNPSYTEEKLNVCSDFKLSQYSNEIYLTQYDGNATHVALPTCLHIAIIGAEVFASNTNIESVTLTDSVLSVEPYSFYCAENLECIIGGKNLSFILDYAFYGCSNLKDILSLESVMTIGEYAFAYSGIEKVSLPNTVSVLFDYSFANCKKLKEFAFNGLCVDIPSGMFLGCDDLERCELTYYCTAIRSDAFTGCQNLKQLYIPCSVKNIYAQAFPEAVNIYCEKNAQFISQLTKSFNNEIYPNYEVVNGELLNYQSETGYDYVDENSEKVIDVPNVVTKICDEVFAENQIVTKVLLPECLDYIGYAAFYYADRIKSVRMPSEMSYIGEHAFNKATSLKSITIPDGLTTIERYAFFQTQISGCRIPNTVIEIKDGAFWHCPLLCSVYIPNSVQTISPMAFADCNIRLTLFGESGSFLPSYVAENSNVNGNNLINCRMGFVLSGNELVSYIGSDKNIQIPFSIGLKKISSEAFKNNTTIESISIASGINEIGDNCFSGCSSLTSLVMPSDIVTYGSNTFSSTNNLKVYCNENTNAYDYCIDNNIQVETDYDIADGVLNRYNGTNSNVVIPNNLCLTQIGNGSYYDGFKDNNSLQTVVIPEGVVYIARDTFMKCNNLTTVVLPNSIMHLESFSFSFCGNLSNVNMPTSLKRIDSYAFAHSVSITNVDLSNVTTIEYHAFDNCSNLENVRFSNTTTSIGVDCFANCPNLTFECIENSYAHTYAIENDIEVRLIEDPSTNSTYAVRRYLAPLNTTQVSDRTEMCEVFNLNAYIEENYGGEITEDNIAQIVLEIESAEY